MEGNNTRLVRDQSALYFSLIAELRTPILELKLAAEIAGNQQSLIIAQNTLELFDGFLYLCDISNNIEQLELSPCSLVAETEDVLHSLTPLAKLYNVDLQLKSTRQRKSVALNRRAFALATRGLLHASITSLQNKHSSRIDVRGMGGQKPSLHVFSADFSAGMQKSINRGNLKRSPVPSSEGIGSGLQLAELLYDAMGSKMRFARNQFGLGFQADFQPTRQMSLIESLA